jgi:hypothetical protein
LIWGALSDEKSGSVVYSCCWTSPAQSFLGPDSHGAHEHILLSLFLRLPQPGGPGSCIYIPQEQGSPIMPPGTGFPFRRLLRLAGLRWRYSNPSPHGNQMGSSQVKVKVMLRPTVSRTATNFSFSLKFSLDSSGFVFCSALSDERTGL